MALDGTGSLAFVTTASYNPTSASFSSVLTSVSSSNQQLSASYIALSGSYNIFSGSASTRITTVSSSQQDISASLLQVSASYIALSGSYNIFSGSASTIITNVSSSQQDISASLLQVSASYIALSGSYNIFSGSASTIITNVSSSQQQISASLLNVIATYATTGSNSFRANQSITGSLVVSSTITAQTLVVQTVTSSIVYSSGSNNFGNQLANTQTFTGSVNITGSLALAGNITSNGTAVVLGSGTSNYLPKFTAASTIGNSLVVDNGTNIGIGTTNPTAGRLQINVSDTTTAAHFQIVDGTTTLADSFVTNFRNANDGDGRYSLSRWQVQNAVGNDQIGFIGVQSITGAGAYTPNIVFGQRTGVSTYATRMTLDSSGNLGLGVTPSAWSLGKGFDINGGMGLLSVSNASFVLNNAYYNGGWIYKASSFAQNFVLNNDGSFQFNIAPSGSANAAITFTQAMTLTAAGELLINTTSDAGDWKLQVNGSAYFTNTNSVGYTYVTIGNSGASGRSYDIGVGGNGVGSPYQNSFYVFDNVANQPRFYINSTGAATFSSNITNVSALYVRASGNSDLPFINFSNADGVYNWGRIGGLLQGDGDGSLYFQTKQGGSLGTRLTITSTGAATFSSTIQTNGNVYILPTLTGGGAGGGLYLGVYPDTQYSKQAILVERYKSASGNYGRGSLHFCNRDTADANLPTLADSKMIITSDGNVLIGTGTTPEGPLDVYKSNSAGLGGHILLRNNGAAVGNETAVLFVDGGVGSTRAAISSTTENAPYLGDIKFKTGAGSYASLTTRMTITGAGVVQITNTSDAQLSLSSGGTSAYVKFANSAGDTWGIGNSFSGANTDFQLYNFTTTAYGFRVSRGGIYANTTATAANVQIDSNGYFARSTSSSKYKNSITNYDKGLDILNQLRPVYYKGNNDGDTIFAGLIAEEVHDLGLTEFVQYAEDGTPDALAYGNMVSLLIKGMQELKAEIELLKTK